MTSMVCKWILVLVVVYNINEIYVQHGSSKKEANYTFTFSIVWEYNQTLFALFFFILLTIKRLLMINVVCIWILVLVVVYNINDIYVEYGSLKKEANYTLAFNIVWEYKQTIFFFGNLLETTTK